jgi:hypothetical protein
MKKVILMVTVLFFIIGCGEDNGKLRILLTDAPPPQNVEHIYLTILGVGIRNADGDAITLQSDYYTVDVIRLTGGYSTSLTYDYSTGSSFVEVEPGDYNSVLIAINDLNLVETDSIQDTLLVPEGTPISYELETDFTVSSSELLTLIIDFDAAKSINWESTPYELIPVFRIYHSDEVGFLTGTVKKIAVDDTTELAAKFAVLEAVSTTDTLTTLTDTAGRFSLSLPEDTYTISAYVEGYATNTTYEDVTIMRDSILEDYNFLLNEQ